MRKPIPCSKIISPIIGPYKPLWIPAVAVLILVYSATAAATCSRDDVRFYLNKGFTHKQITSLCTFTPDTKPRYTPHREPAQQDDEPHQHNKQTQQKTGKQRRKRAQFLKRAISAYDVELTPAALEYTRKQCIRTGLSKNVEERLNTCPQVRYTIGLKGLTVREASKKFIYFGDVSVGVKGNVRQKIVGDLDNYPAPDRGKLLHAFKDREQDGEASIPIRKDIPVDRVVRILRDLSSGKS